MEQALSSKTQKDPPVLLAAYAVGFAFLHLTANLLGWYYSHPWIDIFAHIGGGVWVGWAAYAYCHFVPGYERMPRWARILGVICFTALVGVMWEFLELATDILRLHAWGAGWHQIPDYIDKPPFNVRWDTMKDLFNDILGGVLAAFAVVRKR